MRVRDRLAEVLRHFRENATELYPAELSFYIVSHPLPAKLTRRWRAKSFLDHALVLREDTNSGENLVLEFRIFSQDVTALLDCFVQFPQLVEELPDWSLAAELRVSNPLVDLPPIY